MQTAYNRLVKSSGDVGLCTGWGAVEPRAADKAMTGGTGGGGGGGIRAGHATSTRFDFW